MSAYRSSLFRSLKKEVSEKLPQSYGFCTPALDLKPIQFGGARLPSPLARVPWIPHFVLRPRREPKFAKKF